MIQEFIQEYKEMYQIEEIPTNTLSKYIKTKKEEFTNNFSQPSLALNNKFKELEHRVHEPIKIAIVGQFSSGKSTFLNALLSHNILPSGITPVTAKISYIKYGQDFRLKVVYKNSKEEFYPLEDISKFNDQREDVEDIEYLTLYAPINFLKDITFVDTPGLNSQSTNDTRETLDVLQNVDGMIWLTLIDNAGKNSEKKILEEFMMNFDKKSLCVLNQKDKHTQKNIEKTTKYIQQEFDKYFEDVVAISAKDALMARSNTKEQMEQNLRIEFATSIQNNKIDTLSFRKYIEQIAQIQSLDTSHNKQLLEDSNITSILDFIDSSIRPNIDLTKKKNIEKEIHNINNILNTQVLRYTNIHNELKDIKQSYSIWENEQIENIKKSFSYELTTSFSKIEDIIELISLEIFKNIKPKQVTFIQIKSNKIGFKKYVPTNINIFDIDEDIILQKLFFNEEIVHKLFKTYIKTVQFIQNSLKMKVNQLTHRLKNDITNFQNKYSQITKSNTLESDIQLENLKGFLYGLNESVVREKEKTINTTFNNITLKFSKVCHNIEATYETATKLAIFSIQRAVLENFELYKKDSNFGIYEPTQNEIKEHLKRNLNIEMLENMMCGRRNFLVKEFSISF